MNSEYSANLALATPNARAAELAKWAAVLARPVNHPMRRATVRRSLLARLLGL